MASRSSEGTRPKRDGGERRKRTIYSKEQLEILKRTFQHHPYPSFRMRERLAQLTDIPEPRIHVWFQNRRAREPKADSADACRRVNTPVLQPREMQSTPVSPSQTLLSCSVLDNSRQYWDSRQYQEGCQYLNSTGPVPVPQTDFGWDAVPAGMASGWEGAGNLPMGQQASQPPTFLRTAQPEMNSVAPEQSASWTPGNLQQGEPACRQNSPFHHHTSHHYPVSPQTPYGHRP